MKVYFLTLILFFCGRSSVFANESSAQFKEFEKIFKKASELGSNFQIEEAAQLYNSFIESSAQDLLMPGEYAILSEQVLEFFEQNSKNSKGLPVAVDFLNFASKHFADCDRELGIAYLYTGIFQMRNDQMDSVGENFLHAMDILSSIEDRFLSLFQIGWYNSYIQNHDTSIYYFKLAEQELIQFEDNEDKWRKQAKLYFGMMSSYLKSFDFANSKKSLEKLDKIAGRLNDPVINFRLDYYWAGYYLNNRQTIKAKEYLDGDREYHPKMKNDYMRFYFFKAIVDYQLKLYDSAIINYHKVLDIQDRLNKNNSSKAQTYQWLGEVYRLNKDYENAQKSFDNAIELLIPYGDKLKTSLADTYTFKAKCYIDQSKLNQAKQYYELAKKTHDSLIDGAISSNSKICNIYLEYYNQRQSKIYLDSLFALMSENDELLDSLRISQRFYEDSGPTEYAATSLYSNNLEILKELEGDMDRNHRLHKSYKYISGIKAFSLRQKQRSEYGLKHFKIPSDLIELSKIHSDSISTIEKLIYEEKQAHTEESNLSDTSDKQMSIDSLNAILEFQNDAYQKISSKIESEFPEFLEYKYGLETVTIDEIQTSLQHSEALVEYYIDNSSIYTILIQKNSIHYFTQEKPEDWDTTIDHYIKSCSDYQYQHQDSVKVTFELFTESSLNIYNSIFKNVDDSIDLEVKYLTIIPDEKLHNVQFENLISESPEVDLDYKSLNYLVHDFTFSRATSSYSFIKLKEEERRKNGLNYVGFAPEYNYDETDLCQKGRPEREQYLQNLVTRGSLYDLPYARRSVEIISDLFDGLAFSAKSATKFAFLNSTKKSNILHFAGHSIVDDNNPQFSQLLFSSEDVDSQLYALDVYNVKLDVDVAVLSACNTGIGKLKKGDGVISLARAFEYSGCLSLMTTLWSIPDVESSDVDLNFFINLNQQQRVDDALRNSKLDFLKNSNIKNSHPFYWSGFYVTGKTAPLAQSLFERCKRKLVDLFNFES